MHKKLFLNKKKTYISFKNKYVALLKMYSPKSYTSFKIKKPSRGLHLGKYLQIGVETLQWAYQDIREICKSVLRGLGWPLFERKGIFPIISSQCCTQPQPLGRYYWFLYQQFQVSFFKPELNSVFKIISFISQSLNNLV